MTKNAKYHPEPYWTEVAERIDSRGGNNVIAGDDSPYYRYKRSKFLELFNTLTFTERDVLEIGSGPGGNLLKVAKKQPNTLNAVDISQKMIDMAKVNTAGSEISFTKIDGTSLPFLDNHFDIVFSVTVLQHNTDDQMMRALLGEMCRVSKNTVAIFERIERNLKGDELCMGRPVHYYQDICKSHGFELKDTQFLNIEVSFLVSGAIRKIFNRRNRKEGQKLNTFSEVLQSISLPVTKLLDRVISSRRNVAKLEFVRIK